MKLRFNNYDIICGVTELQKLIGLRVNQIYDIDNKTYLIKFQHSDSKCVLLLESGIRFHTTGFEWPKNVAPSGFSMKMRKHLKNKRLEKLEQLGVDRIVDLQFGSGEAAYHVILELYDRGNIILTDHELTILNILRPHVEGEETRFAVREKYPLNRARIARDDLNEQEVMELVNNAKAGDNLRRILTPILDCGASVIDHVLIKYELEYVIVQGKTEENDPNKTCDQQSQVNSSQQGTKKSRKQKKKDAQNPNTRLLDMEKDLSKLMYAIKDANEMIAKAKKEVPKGYIIQKKEVKPSEKEDVVDYYYQNVEYQPFLFNQFKDEPNKEFETFMAAVDEFYSTLEGQKIDLKTMQQEREALKKLSNVKKDHEKRLEELTKVQEMDKMKAELITRNQSHVDNAILAIRSAIANQMSWADIHELVKAAQLNGDPVASSIKQLKLEINHIALTLHDPYYENEETESENEEDEPNNDRIPSMVVDVDLGLSAFANARKYYDQKRSAAKKEQRTIDASQKALKSAEKKTQQTLKEVRTISTISKARKVYWFEKFYWFVSSENFLVIGGRDAQQNELIVKRYMRPSDIYVHAEIQGAASVVIRNPTGNEVPPKTLLEAGTMAICYSVAWDAKVVTNAYWVKSEQVSKTAPTGEYLTAGSFMIRGKKNFLPPCHLIMGISVLFKLEDSSIERHKGERRIRTFEEENETIVDKLKHFEIENEKLDAVPEDGKESDEEVKLVESDNEKDSDNEDSKNAKEEKHLLPEEEHNSEESGEEEGAVKFPDTHIKVDHGAGVVTVQTSVDYDKNTKDKVGLIDDTAKGNKNDSTAKDEEEANTPYIISAAPARKKQQSITAKKKKEERQRTISERKERDYERRSQRSQNQPQEQQSSNQQQPKRGQKGKMKKIKAKYKDQDEEERQMRMQILKSAGNQKLIDQEAQKQEEEAKQRNRQQRKQFEPKQQADGGDDDDTAANADVDMLDSLTGCPVEEDELLFAIPIIAPYQTLQNYKYKIKLTPGTGKRGKAAKTALLMFSKDKACSTREKDLLKGIKEETLARNIPGKVKLSAPQLQKLKK